MAPGAFREQQQLLEGLQRRAHTQSPQGCWQAPGPAGSVPADICTILPMAALALQGLTASPQREQSKGAEQKKTLARNSPGEGPCRHILLLNGPEILVEISV